MQCLAIVCWKNRGRSAQKNNLFCSRQIQIKQTGKYCRTVCKIIAHTYWQSSLTYCQEKYCMKMFYWLPGEAFGNVVHFNSSSLTTTGCSFLWFCILNPHLSWRTASLHTSKGIGNRQEVDKGWGEGVGGGGEDPGGSPLHHCSAVQDRKSVV